MLSSRVQSSALVKLQSGEQGSRRGREDGGRRDSGGSGNGRRHAILFLRITQRNQILCRGNHFPTPLYEKRVQIQISTPRIHRSNVPQLRQSPPGKPNKSKVQNLSQFLSFVYG